MELYLYAENGECINMCVSVCVCVCVSVCECQRYGLQAAIAHTHIHPLK